MRIVYLTIPILLAAVYVDKPTDAAEPRSFACEEPLPEFTLGPESDPSESELEQLCKCIWSKFPEDGWERRTSEKIVAGEDPGWRLEAFIPRFGAALKACGGYNL